MISTTITTSEGQLLKVTRSCEEPCDFDPTCRILFELKDETSEVAKQAAVHKLLNENICDGAITVEAVK